MKANVILISNLCLATTIILLASFVNCHTRIGDDQIKEEVRLGAELDSLKIKVEHVHIPKTRMEAELREKNSLLVSHINLLRQQISKKGTLTPSELLKAENDIKQLKYFISQYYADMELLNKRSQK